MAGRLLVAQARRRHLTGRRQDGPEATLTHRRRSHRDHQCDGTSRWRHRSLCHGPPARAIPQPHHRPLRAGERPPGGRACGLELPRREAGVGASRCGSRGTSHLMGVPGWPRAASSQSASRLDRRRSTAVCIQEVSGVLRTFEDVWRDPALLQRFPQLCPQECAGRVPGDV